MTQNVPLNDGSVAVEAFFDATQEMLSGLAVNFTLARLNATTLRVAAGSGHDQVSLAIAGQYRYVTAPVDRAMVGGSAGTYDVYATAAANQVGTNAPPSNNYAFALAIVATGGTPSGVDIYRLVGQLVWDGAAITSVKQLAASVSGVRLTDDAITAGGAVVATRQPGGGFLFDVAPLGITNAHVAAGAAIDETKVALASDAAAGTASRRTLGIVGTSAAAGNDARFPTANEKAALAGVLNAPAVGNRYMTEVMKPFLAPMGAIIGWPQSLPPPGWILADGREMPITSLPDMDALIGGITGRTDGAGASGSTYFRIPYVTLTLGVLVGTSQWIINTGLLVARGVVAPIASDTSGVPIDFGNNSLSIGSAGVTRTINPNNVGSASVAYAVGGVTLVGPNAGDFTFTGTNTTAGTTRAPGVTSTITVRFRATVLGVRTAQVRIVSDALNSPTFIALTGNGTS